MRRAIAVALLASAVGCKGSDTAQHAPPEPRAQVAQPTNAPACRVQRWVFDPSDVSGCAADDNDCEHSTCSGKQGPCANVDQILQRMGGACTWGQPTVIEQMSADTGSAHPVTLRGTVAAGGSLVFQCDLPAPTTTSTLTAATAKARTANTVQTYSDTVGMGVVTTGMLVEDAATGASAWVASKLTAATAYVTQPLLATSAPATTLVPAESDSAAAGDGYSAYSLVAANLVAVDVQVTDVGSYADAGLLAQQPVTVSHCRVNDPNGAAKDPLYVGLGVTFVETRIDRKLVLSGGEGEAFDVGCVNCFFAGGLTGGRASTGYRWRVSGGIFYPSPGAVYNPAGQGITVDGDVWLGSNLTLPQGGTLVSYNAQAPTSSAGDAGTTVNGYGFTQQILTTNGYPTLYSWGGGTNNSEGQWHFDSSNGGLTGINSNRITVNGQVTACSWSAQLGVQSAMYCQIPLDNAHMDNQFPGNPDGGFAERAFGYYGASMSGNVQ
jgi:hypothetical protein